MTNDDQTQEQRQEEQEPRDERREPETGEERPADLQPDDDDDVKGGRRKFRT